ncbi:20044_t:CDS:2, partial [Entrophospora sp. SA101]
SSNSGISERSSLSSSQSSGWNRLINEWENLLLQDEEAELFSTIDNDEFEMDDLFIIGSNTSCIRQHSK